VPIDRDPPTGDVVQAGDQSGERGLARTGGADQGERRTGRQVQVDVVQDVGGVRAEPEADVLEPEVTARVLQLVRP
jgi:hypothetical protein